MDKELYGRVADAMLGAALLPLVKSVKRANDARKELLSSLREPDLKIKADLADIRNGLEEILYYVAVICDFLSPGLDCDDMDKACEEAFDLIHGIEKEYQ